MLGTTRARAESFRLYIQRLWKERKKNFLSIKSDRKRSGRPYLVQEEGQVAVALHPLRKHVVHHGLTRGADLHGSTKGLLARP